ncbi:hypothetical protein GCM10009776_08350 [Microbacterium deminutum]|uniref:Uncharacterized protein n=2 Tax=Microbacterium deminutum TaxID=344164 RepID=A0ABN2QB71_9MICO
MAYSAQPLDEITFGGGVAMTENGLVAGIDEANRTAWIYRDGGIDFLAFTTRELIASDVNVSGVVVGHQGDRDAATVWVFDSTLRDIQSKLSTQFGRARAISDNGVVVGARRTPPAPVLAYRLDLSNDELTPIPMSETVGPEYVSSEAVVVSADGRLAAGLAWKEFGSEPRGFLYDHSTRKTTDLGTTILPRAMNEVGKLAGSTWPSGITVTYDIASKTTRTHGGSFLAEGMNDAGQVVGSLRGGGDLPSACVSRPGQLPVDLNSAVTGIAGWLVSASDIINDGRILVTAIVVDASGARHSRPYILTPV